MILGSQFGETVHISEVNGARKVKSDAQVATNKNPDPVQKFFPYERLGERVSPTHFVFKFNDSRATKLIFGLQVNIDKSQISRYPVDGT